MKGEPIPKPGVPESFRVLVKELQSLGLDMKVLDSSHKEIELRDLDDDDDVVNVDALSKLADKKKEQEDQANKQADEKVEAPSKSTNANNSND